MFLIALIIIARFYFSVQLNNGNSVTAKPGSEAAKRIISFIIYTCAFPTVTCQNAL